MILSYIKYPCLELLSLQIVEVVLFAESVNSHFCISRVLSQYRKFCQQLDVVIVNYDYWYYTLHNFLLVKINNTNWMFYGKLAVEGDNPNINTVEGGNRLSPSL